MKRRTILLLIFIGLMVSVDCHGAEAVKVPRKVLFIGNSYTAQSKREIGNVVKALGLKTKLDFITPGGCTLQRHAGTGGTVAKISAGWDVVVLQEQSQIPSFPAGQLQRQMYPAARVLDGLIKKKGGRTVFFMTWGRRDGDKRNKINDTFDKMQKNLTAGYANIAVELGAGIAPIGPAWAKVPAAKRGILYSRDGSHPSAAGAYLNACVLSIVVFGKDPTGMKYTGRLSATDAKFLQETAVGAVKEWRKTEEELKKAAKKVR